MSTLPLEIRNPGAALSILGESCDYFQQFRELTENVADQARAFPDQEIICDWGFEKGIHKNGLKFGTVEIPAGTFKLACVDNGPGMSEATLTGPIRSLFSSGTGHENGNFGIGAKVAGLSRNASNGLGMLFITKQAGEPALCALLTANGLMQQDVLVDGEIEPWAVISCASLSIKVPRLIEKSGHGTAVVLLGNTADADTVKPSRKVWDELPGKKRVWLPQYLLRRYSQFPSNLKVSGFEVGALTDSGDYYPSNGRNATVITSRPVRPFSAFLDEFSLKKGTIQLTSATAEWHIIDTSKKTTLGDHMTTSSDRSGMAVEWRHELYEREPAGSLGKFGIYTGERNVFIVIRPEEKIVSSNATRDALHLDGRPLRGDIMRDWAGQFRHKVKDTELGAWMAAQGHKQSGDARNRVLDVLKRCGASLKIKGFQIGAGENQTAVSPSPTGVPAVDPNGDGASSTDRSGKGKGVASRNLPVTIDPRGQLIGSPSNTDCAPDISWEDSAAFDRGARQAGKYSLSGENPLGVLTLNRDFKFFGELKRMLLDTVKRYAKAQDFTDEQLNEICQNLVEFVVACEMSESILRAYLNAKVLGSQWSQDQLDDLFRPEVLAVMTLRSSTAVPYMTELFRGTAKEWLNVRK